MRDYGLEMKQAREETPLNIEQAANIMGWDRKKLSRFENGHQIPYIDEFEQYMAMMAGVKLVASFKINWPIGQLTAGRV